MIGTFRQKSPANILSLLLLSVVLKLPMFLHPHVPTLHPKDGFLYHAILQWLLPAAKNFPAFFSLLAFVILFIEALWLNRIVSEHRLMQRQNFLPAMAFMLITSLFPEWNYFSAPLLVNLALLYVIAVSFKLHNQALGKGTIYNAGLAVGVASFLFFPAIGYFILTIFALMVMRPFRFNEWIICLMGVVTPFYFYATYLFFYDRFDLQRILPYVNIGLPALKQSIWRAAATFLVTIPFLAGSYYVQDNMRRVLIQVRKAWSIVLIYLIIGISIPFINNGNSFENWVMAAIPLAVFHSGAYLYPAKKWIPVVIFWVMIAFTLAYQYIGPGW